MRRWRSSHSATAGSVRALADVAMGGGTGRPGRWADLRKRAVSAGLLAPVALWCIWVGGVPWALLMGCAAVGLGLEWAALCGARARLGLGLIAAALVLGAGVGGLVAMGLPGWAVVVLGAAAGLVWGVTRGGALAAGVLYVGVPLVALAWLRGSGEVGRAEVLFVVAVVWASDIGAYAVGRLLGGPKLAPSISPGKTWSGALGGLVIAMAAGACVAWALAPGSVGVAGAAACVLGVVSAAGDLGESWVKRRFGVKDSGTLIPGHGGLLDRLDGLLAAAPVAALMALVHGRGGVLWS